MPRHSNPKSSWPGSKWQTPEKQSDWSDWDKPLDPVDWKCVKRDAFKRVFLDLSVASKAGKMSKRCPMKARTARNSICLNRPRRNRKLLKAKKTDPVRRIMRRVKAVTRCSPPHAKAPSREALQICIDEDPYGNCPDPVASFDELGVLPRHVIDSLNACGITKPLPIQAQALPLALAGRDVIGLAQTGSGKTLAFLLPAVVHIEAQAPIGDAVSPIALILAPTRELAVQICDEVAKVLYRSKNSGSIWACSAYGGGDKKQQLSKIRGSHILAATPGRLMDFVREKAVSLHRVTYFVLDEADRMLDMGFQGDVMSLSGQVRPERQMLFFSATWSAEVQQLAAGLCHARPVRISVGQRDRGEHAARKGIDQKVVVVDHGGDWEKQEKEKNALLDRHLREVLLASSENKVLVFVSQKKLADELAWKLQSDGFKADSMHGGKSQDCRLWVLEEFRQGRLRLLVCTDVLGRGIDIPSVSHVVIHEMGLIEDYIHRIGRTARGKGARGHALVFFEYWEKEPQLAKQLIEVLRASEQPVPAALEQIAADVDAGRRKIASY